MAPVFAPGFSKVAFVVFWSLLYFVQNLSQLCMHELFLVHILCICCFRERCVQVLLLLFLELLLGSVS